MPALAQLVRDLGHDDVSTLLQSGNVLFTSSKSGAALESGLEAAITRELGMDVNVLVRSAAQIKRVIEGNPLPEAEHEPSKLVVAFLSGKPDAKGVAALEAHDGPEVCRATKDGLYIWFREGQGRSKLMWERGLGVTPTARNWNTVTKIHALLT